MLWVFSFLGTFPRSTEWATLTELGRILLSPQISKVFHCRSSLDHYAIPSNRVCLRVRVVNQVLSLTFVSSYELMVRKIGIVAASFGGQVIYPLYEISPFRK